MLEFARGWRNSELISITFETIPEMSTLLQKQKTTKIHTPLSKPSLDAKYKAAGLDIMSERGYFTNEWQYAITNPSPDAGLVHPNGDLSPLGQVYVNLGRRLNQVNASEYTEPIFAWVFASMPKKFTNLDFVDNMTYLLSH